MRYILFIFFLWGLATLQSQTLEGSFSCQGEETAHPSPIQLTAIAGQSFEGTKADSPLSYGWIETVSTANEYTNVSALTLEKQEVSIEEGESFSLTATFSPEEVDNPTVRWFSSDPQVAAVADGIVSARQKGKATITVVSACGVYASRCEVEVRQSEPDPEPEPEPEPDPVYVTGVSLDLTEANLEAGEELTLTATVYPANADNKRVTWSSSDETIATVTEGLVTAHAVGKAIIQVKTEEGGYTARCEVTVETDPTSIEAIGKSHRLRITREYLYLELPQAQTIYLVDLAGRSCTSIACEAGENRIPVQAYPSGIYLLRMELGTVKVIKP